VPVHHRISVRTTNLAERSVEGRRRTTVIVRLTSDLEHH
jgi:hypothetical protein